MKKLLIGILLVFSLAFCLISCSSQSSEAAKTARQTESELAGNAEVSSEADNSVSESGQTESAAEQTSQADASETASEGTSTLNIPTEETLDEEEAESETAKSMTKEDIKAHMLADGRYYNDSKYYSFTPIPDTEVNQFAEDIQFAFLEESWWNLAEMIQFPITIQGVQYNSQSEFNGHSWSTVFTDDWLIGLMDDTCYHMEVENDSIRMADGRIFIVNVFDSDGTPKLLIKTINV